MTKLPCRKSDVMFIVWKDAVSEWTRGQLDEASSLQLAVNTNVGWVIHEDNERIVFCNGTSTTGEMDHLVIPAANVIERVPLRTQRKGVRDGSQQSSSGV